MQNVNKFYVDRSKHAEIMKGDILISCNYHMFNEFKDRVELLRFVERMSKAEGHKDANIKNKKK